MLATACDYSYHNPSVRPSGPFYSCFITKFLHLLSASMKSSSCNLHNNTLTKVFSFSMGEIWGAEIWSGPHSSKKKDLCLLSPDERTRVLWTTLAFLYASLGHDTYVSGPDYFHGTLHSKVSVPALYPCLSNIPKSSGLSTLICKLGVLVGMPR